MDLKIARSGINAIPLVRVIGIYLYIIKQLKTSVMIQSLIGVSSLFIPVTYGETLEDAIEIIKNAGFKCFEIVPGDQAVIGYPYNIPSVSLWPRSFSKKQRMVLKDRLSVFNLCTIHAPHTGGLNISSFNKGIRQESIKQYMECLELAADLEIETVTFHMGYQDWGYIRSEEDIIKYEVEFAKKAAYFAEINNLKVGYETQSFRRLEKILQNFEPREFGVNFDLADASMQGIDPLKWIDSYAKRVVEVHFDPICQQGLGFLYHVPVQMNNAINFNDIMLKIKDINFDGPIICEILGNNIQQVLKANQEAKDIIIKLWEET